MPRGRRMRNTEIPVDLHEVLRRTAADTSTSLAALHAELLTDALRVRGYWPLEDSLATRAVGSDQSSIKTQTSHPTPVPSASPEPGSGDEPVDALAALLDLLPDLPTQYLLRGLLPTLPETRS